MQSCKSKAGVCPTSPLALFGTSYHCLSLSEHTVPFTSPPLHHADTLGRKLKQKATKQHKQISTRW